MRKEYFRSFQPISLMNFYPQIEYFYCQTPGIALLQLPVPQNFVNRLHQDREQEYKKYKKLCLTEMNLYCQFINEQIQRSWSKSDMAELKKTNKQKKQQIEVFVQKLNKQLTKRKLYLQLGAQRWSSSSGSSDQQKRQAAAKEADLKVKRYSKYDFS